MLSVRGGAGVGINQAMHIPDKQYSTRKGTKASNNSVAMKLLPEHGAVVREQ